MGDEIGADLDKMKSRERHINQQLDHLVQKLRVSHDRLAQVQVDKRRLLFPRAFLFRKATIHRRQAWLKNQTN